MWGVGAARRLGAPNTEDGPAEVPVTNGNTATGQALNDDLDIFGPMISNPLPATVLPPAQHLDPRRCCGLSSVWPQIPDGQRAFGWGSRGLRKVRTYRQQWFSFTLEWPCRPVGRPHHPARKWPLEHLLARLAGVAVLRLCPCGGRRSSEETYAPGARGCSSVRWSNSSFPKHSGFSHTSVSPSGNRPQVLRLNRNYTCRRIV
ncbi:hypothetical protein J1605_014951 [Eschrichtius robustus]|uniref:Uncharacterized protein n=1 Tax=Eschrichtius robustus TaxID=9764 RepID=A0AB34GCR4_ESCRO|nr:hypothetical protein J1605_014951 [Eschrichtius robustus]